MLSRFTAKEVAEWMVEQLRKVPRAELKPRIASLYQNPGRWIGCPNEDDILQEYEDWGHTRFRQDIPFSEIVYALILTKKHLRKFIREHGLVDFSGDRVTPDELVPVEFTPSRD